MIFSQDDLDFDFENSDESGYVVMMGANNSMMEAMWDSLEDLGFSPIGSDTDTIGAIGIEFYIDDKSDTDNIERQIRDYFEESFRLSYEGYNDNLDWES